MLCYAILYYTTPYYAILIILDKTRIDYTIILSYNISCSRRGSGSQRRRPRAALPSPRAPLLV